VGIIGPRYDTTFRNCCVSTQDPQVTLRVTDQLTFLMMITVVPKIEQPRINCHLGRLNATDQFLWIFFYKRAFDLSRPRI
jgi:hypothetical protein